MKFNSSLLKKDINLYMRTFGEAYVTEAIDEIENTAKNCVMYFYDSYKPKAYDRTYQFLDNSITSKTWKIKDGFSGYVDIMSDITGGKMIYGDYELSDDEIRETNWNGVRYNVDEVIIPSPMYYLSKFYKCKEFNHGAISKAKRIARSKNYSCINKV